MSLPDLEWRTHADVVVIGTGAAGLATAITARDLGLSVLVVTKASAGAGSTRCAMGGIAAAMPEPDTGEDSPATHVMDTVTAGAGLTDRVVAEAIVREAPAAIGDLTRWGMPWDRDEHQDLVRGREGGHSAARILHARDATGRELSATLLRQATSRPPRPRKGSITLLEHHTVVNLLHTAGRAVVGVLALDGDGRWGVATGPVVLATGGIGQTYQATTNPEGTLGDGLALALRAGCLLGDMEFVQFHPTALYTGAGARGQVPLVTEAIRGHDCERPAVLVDQHGVRVMDRTVHPLGDLAPRDVVAAAITRRMTDLSTDHVYLDATGLGTATFAQCFPTVLAACRSIGIDPARTPIPVTPAAHFLCGGVVTTADGRTGVRGLYAVGEVARTGLHGANRLASNSLLEGLVVGARVARAVLADRLSGRVAGPVGLRPVWIPRDEVAPLETVRSVMTRYAGMSRDGQGLAAAAAELAEAASTQALDTPQRVAEASALVVARAVITAANAREETRGCHQRTDYPHVAHQRYGQDLVTVSVATETSEQTMWACWAERSTG